MLIYRLPFDARVDLCREKEKENTRRMAKPQAPEPLMLFNIGTSFSILLQGKGRCSKTRVGITL